MKFFLDPYYFLFLYRSYFLKIDLASSTLFSCLVTPFHTLTPVFFFFFSFLFFRLLGTFSFFRILLCIIHARKSSCAGELLWDVGMSERDGERRGEGEWEEGREGGERRRKAGGEMVSEVLALFFVPPWEKLQLSVWLWLRGVMGVAEEGGWGGGEGN